MPWYASEYLEDETSMMSAECTKPRSAEFWLTRGGRAGSADEITTAGQASPCPTSNSNSCCLDSHSTQHTTQHGGKEGVMTFIRSGMYKICAIHGRARQKDRKARGIVADYSCYSMRRDKRVVQMSIAGQSTRLQQECMSRREGSRG